MRLLLCLLLACASAFGQSFTFRTITFEGAPQYTQADLLSMCGLVPGKTVSQAELDIALHKLNDTGLFTSIDYKSEGPVLHIKLVPEAGHQARPLQFNNFVLDTPAELDTKLRARVPLFTGTVPVVGDLQAKIERALESILKDEASPPPSRRSAARAAHWTTASPPRPSSSARWQSTASISA